MLMKMTRKAVTIGLCPYNYIIMCVATTAGISEHRRGTIDWADECPDRYCADAFLSRLSFVLNKFGSGIVKLGNSTAKK